MLQTRDIVPSAARMFPSRRSREPWPIPLGYGCSAATVEALHRAGLAQAARLAASGDPRDAADILRSR